MNLFIYTLTWNGADLLNNLHDKLYDNLYNLGLDYKWFIRDNGSVDNTLDLISGWENVEVMVAGHNRDSFSVGMNSLIDFSGAKGGDVLLFLNNDIEFCDDKNLINMIDLIGNFSVVGAKLLYPNNTISHQGVIFDKQKWGMLPWHFRMGEKDIFSANLDFQAVTAACCLIKYSDFALAGKFDTAFRWAFEDISLNLELSLNHKKKIICCGNTKIIHQTSKTLNKNPVHKMFMQQNVNAFKNKWWENGKPRYKLDHEDKLKKLNSYTLRCETGHLSITGGDVKFSKNVIK